MLKDVIKIDIAASTFSMDEENERLRKEGEKILRYKAVIRR
jgi:hypothetical protein